MRMVYIGPDEWNGPVYLEHGKAYEVRPMTKKNSRSKAYLINVEDFVENHVLTYSSKKATERYWKKV